MSHDLLHRLPHLLADLLRLLSNGVNPGDQHLVQVGLAVDPVGVLMDGQVPQTPSQLVQRIGREPTLEELAQELGISVDETLRVLKISKHPTSLDKPIGEGDDRFLVSVDEFRQRGHPAVCYGLHEFDV